MVCSRGALFEFDHENIESSWRIYGTGGDFELTFSAGHGYHANGASPKMSSNFHQLFGSFNGWIRIRCAKDRSSCATWIHEKASICFGSVEPCVLVASTND